MKNAILEDIIDWLCDAVTFIFGKDCHDKIVKWVKEAERMTIFLVMFISLALFIFLPRLFIAISVFCLFAFYLSRKLQELIK